MTRFQTTLIDYLKSSQNENASETERELFRNKYGAFTFIPCYVYDSCHSRLSGGYGTYVMIH